MGDMIAHTQQYVIVIYIVENIVHRDYSKRMRAHADTRAYECMHTQVTTDHKRELAADQDSRAEWKATEKRKKKRTECLNVGYE